MIIGLTGYAQSGKDSVANILVEEYGYQRVAFADKIREFVYELNPTIQIGYDTTTTVKLMVDHGGWDEAKQNSQVRELLQNTGVTARKVFGEYFWIHQAMRPVNFEQNWVITDVRFLNEVEFIKKYDNAQIWRVKRPGVDAVNTHVSETEMEDYKVDQILKNDGTLDDLREKIKTRIELSLNAN